MAKKPEVKKEKIEREYTIPLREKCRVVPRYKKTNKAIKTIKEFLARHMQIRDRDLKKIKLDKHINEFIWARGIKKPPAKIKIKAVKEGDIVKAELYELPKKFKLKKAREEKIDKKATEIASQKKKALEKLKEKATPAQSTETDESKSEKEEAKEEKKKIEEVKKSAVIEDAQKLEKSRAKQAKHMVGGKTTQPKRQIRKALEK